MKLSSPLGPVCPLPWGQHRPGSVVWALGASPTCVFPLCLWVGRTQTWLGARPSLWLRLRSHWTFLGQHPAPGISSFSVYSHSLSDSLPGDLQKVTDCPL